MKLLREYGRKFGQRSCVRSPQVDALHQMRDGRWTFRHTWCAQSCGNGLRRQTNRGFHGATAWHCLRFSVAGKPINQVISGPLCRAAVPRSHGKPGTKWAARFCDLKRAGRDYVLARPWNDALSEAYAMTEDPNTRHADSVTH